MKKIFVIILAVLFLSIIGGIFYLKLSCKALQIVRTHNGQTIYSITSQAGNEYEPAQCNGSLIIQGIE